MTIIHRAAGPLAAGIATADITPEHPELLAATGLPRRNAIRGVLDPLSVGALCLEVGGEPWVVLTSDLRRVWYPWMDAVRRRIGAELGCDPRRVLTSAVHNHSSSPAAADAESAESRAALEAAEAKIVDAFVRAALKAHASRRTAELCVTSAELAEPVGRNRRMVLSTGTVVNCWHAGGIVPPGAKIAGRAGPHSSHVGLVSVREPGAADPFGVLVSYATHPHLIGVPYFGAELPGAVRRAVAERLGGATVLTANATGGDLDLHRAFPVPACDDAGEVAWVRETFAALGTRIAEAAAPALAACDAWTADAEVRQAYWSAGEPEPSGDEPVTLERAMAQPILIVNVVALGDAALVDLPGELFATYGERIRAASPLRETVLLGYNGSNNAYLVPPLDAERGGYEVMHGFAAAGTTELMPCGRRVKPELGSGDAVCERVVALLGEVA